MRIDVMSNSLDVRHRGRDGDVERKQNNRDCRARTVRPHLPKTLARLTFKGRDSRVGGTSGKIVKSDKPKL